MDDFPELASGALYLPSEPAMLAVQLAHQTDLARFNALAPSDPARAVQLAQLCAAAGPDCVLASPVFANWGLAHVTLGAGVRAGAGLMLVDDGPITIGPGTVLGVRVTLATGGHPVWPALREAGWVHNQAIVIGARCVLGDGVTVMPGVTLGDDVWCAPGSVVTRDLPSGSVVAGAPAAPAGRGDAPVKLSEKGAKTMDDVLSNGDLYLPGDAALMQEQLKWQDLQARYNQTLPSAQAERSALLTQMFGEIGPDCYIEAPMHANWSGHHAHFGRQIYANYGLTMVDDGPIYVGDYTMIGPNVVLATAGHPVEPSLRARGYHYNMPVHIGRNCWLGAGVIVLPGITIGDNVVVGAGSVVTHDLPDGVVAVGNPCRVLRPVSAHDCEFYFKDRRIDWSAIPTADPE